MLANYKATKFSYKEEVIDGEAGTVYRSMSWLADRWGWSRKKVRRFLNLLQNDRMVDVKADKQGTTISIVNYEDFQGGVSTGVATDVPTRVSTGVATDDPHTRKIKKDKEGKEGKEGIEPSGSDGETENEPDWQAIWDSLPDATPGIEGAEE